jgi:hypothetical protein
MVPRIAAVRDVSSYVAKRGYAALGFAPWRTSGGRSAVTAEKLFELLEVSGDARTASGSQVMELKVEDGLRADVVDAELVAQSLPGFLRGGEDPDSVQYVVAQFHGQHDSLVDAD